MFVSSKPGYYQEDRKAQIKNHNLPILQHLYMGNRDTPLECLITKTPGFVTVPDIVTKQSKVRFRLDFNHIRQKSTFAAHPGYSLDKWAGAPSGIFRETRFDDRTSKAMYSLFEFMTIIPTCTEYHSYISQDSAKNDITLKHYAKSQWPWALRTEKNYTKFTEAYRIDGIPYEQFIDHLSNIEYPALHKRLDFNMSTRKFFLTDD